MFWSPSDYSSPKPGMADFLKWHLSFKIKLITKFILQINMYRTFRKGGRRKCANDGRELTLPEAILTLLFIKLTTVLDVQCKRLCSYKTRLVDV